MVDNITGKMTPTVFCIYHTVSCYFRLLLKRKKLTVEQSWASPSGGVPEESIVITG